MYAEYNSGDVCAIEYLKEFPWLVDTLTENEVVSGDNADSYNYSNSSMLPLPSSRNVKHTFDNINSSNEEVHLSKRLRVEVGENEL